MLEKCNAKLEKKNKSKGARTEMMLTRSSKYSGSGRNNITNHMTVYDSRNADLFGDFLEEIYMAKYEDGTGMCGWRVILHSAPGL